MSIVTQEISAEIVASKKVVRMLYEKCTGTNEFDKGKQRSLMDPTSAVFSASYLAAFLKQNELVESHGKLPRIWTKGADSIMRPLLDTSDSTKIRSINESWSVMSKFATVGLRTLVVGTRAFPGPSAGEPGALE